MKKIIIPILAILMLIISSRSFAVGGVTPGLYIKESDTEVKGTMYDEIKFHLNVGNNGTKMAQVQVGVQVLEIAPGHTLGFCWDLSCLSNINSDIFFPDYVVEILPGEDSGDLFKGTMDQGVEKGGGNGTTIAVWYFVDKSDPTNKAEVMVTIEIGQVSVIEYSVSGNFQIFPNPSTDFAQITYTDNISSNSFVNIMDVTGSSVMSKKIIEGNVNLDLRELSNGIYLVGIYSDGILKETRKLIVNH